MKFSRRKQVKHTLNTYKSIFRYHEPFLIIADGTFCSSAAKYNVEIRKHLNGYLNAAIQCCTTKCILNELELLGEKMFRARMIAQRFQLRQCRHKKPVSAASCIKSLLRNKEGVKFFVATQDPVLTQLIRSEPGIPLLYIYKSIVMLEKPSKTTMAEVKLRSEKQLSLGSEGVYLNQLKEEAGLIPPPTENDSIVERKRKRRKKSRK